MGKLLLMSFMLAMIAIPTRNSRLPDARKGLELTIKQIALAALVYTFILKFIWPRYAW